MATAEWSVCPHLNPQNFSSYPHLMLMMECERGAWWAPVTQARLTHHTTIFPLQVETVHKWSCINESSGNNWPGSLCGPFQLGQRTDAFSESFDALNLVIIFTNSHCIKSTTGIWLFSPGTIKGLVEYRRRLNLHGKLSMLCSIRRCCCAKFVANHVAKLQETAERRN